MDEPSFGGAESEPRPSRADLLRRWVSDRKGRIVTAVLIALAIVTAVLVGPGIHASGELEEFAALELGAAQSPPQAETSGAVTEDENGYRVGARSQATVTLPVTLPRPRDGRTLLRVWAYGPKGVTTNVVLRTADGSQRPLGRAVEWEGETFDVSAEALGGYESVRLEVTSRNATADSTLFFDRVAPVLAPESLSITASSWPVGLLVALVAAALLAVANRLRQHWILAALLGGVAVVLWSDIPTRSLEPLNPDFAPTWSAAVDASWFGFHDGLLWGSWKGLSSLSVQVFHALTPIVGTAPGSARAASLLAGLCALAAIYAFGNRAAGRLGAVVAFGCAIAAAGFSDAVVNGDSLPVLVLAGALMGYALHACLAEATPLAIGLLAGGVTLLALAEPTWLPGGLVVLVIVALVCGRQGQRRRVVGIGLITLIVLLTPHLASTASQNSGSLFANLSARSIAARNIEFLGMGHGSPTIEEAARDPFAGRPVTLPGYLFGDHSVSQVVGGVLAGGQESLSAFGERGGRGFLGTIAFLLVVLGVLYLLILPRLRLLVMLPPFAIAPTLFIANRTDGDPWAAAAAVWPAMLVSAGILAYAAAGLARPAIEPRVSAIANVRSRLPKLSPRRTSTAVISAAPKRQDGRRH